MTTASLDRPLDLANRILSAHGELERLARDSGLEPGGPADHAFTDLVALCGHRPTADTDAVLADPRVGAVAGRLRELCADGEFRLERAWARRIVAAADPDRELRAFPYLQNYRELVALERHALLGLLATRATPPRVCVLGSGPLPLTALLLARGLDATVEAVDLDPGATRLARAALGRLSGGAAVVACCADAGRHPGVQTADVVVLAALVGLDATAKRAVVDAVTGRMRPGALLLVRTAHRLRTLLYPPLSVDELAAAGGGRLRPMAEVRPMTAVVNSFLVAERT